MLHCAGPAKRACSFFVLSYAVVSLLVSFTNFLVVAFASVLSFGGRGRGGSRSSCCCCCVPAIMIPKHASNTAKAKKKTVTTVTACRTGTCHGTPNKATQTSENELDLPKTARILHPSVSENQTRQSWVGCKRNATLIGRRPKFQQFFGRST